ncbi:MAG: PorP/SprF family type IX secretion system membrane protein [Saprospiraceae bacterium]|jgi:type IX secretion system PorP/SprF family membrane protein
MTQSILRSLFILALLVSFQPNTVEAQDKHFTQFYATPLTLNPALTGAFEGRYRVGAIYRDQWRRVLDNPIRTYAVSGDFRFPASRKSVRDDAVGFGLMFFNDRVSVIDFNTTQIALSLAFHKSLDVSDRQYLSGGIQAGVTQRNVNYESLNFHDEFDGLSGYNLPTLENLPENNFSYADYNVGINYSAQFGRSGGVYAGIAYHHFLEPTISFYKNGAEGDKLYAKLSGQFAANIPITNRASFLPRFLIALQGPHMQINTGGNFRFTMGKYGTTALHFGTWVRPVRNESSIGLDAIVGLMGLEYNNVLMGLSYDLNLNALSSGQRQTAFEISIAYLGEYESEEILCPKF